MVPKLTCVVRQYFIKNFLMYYFIEPIQQPQEVKIGNSISFCHPGGFLFLFLFFTFS